MNVKTGTKVRILLCLLLLAATALGGLTGRAATKNAAGCSFLGGFASIGGCEYGSGSCYDCLYSDSQGYIRCWESPDGWGGWLVYCGGWSPENQIP